jgi:hypothetical protein
MAETVLGSLIYFVYVVTVALSPVLALGIVLVSRRRSVTAALGTVIGAVAGLVTLGATVGVALLSWQAGLVVFLAGQGALVGLGVVPLVIGRTIVRQATKVDREAALRVAVTVWPLALAASFALFVAPRGPDWYNLTRLSGLDATLAWAGWSGVVLLGPGVLGAVGVRVLRRLR